MKTLYLHIGTPKTATSTIQMFLAKNRSVLKRKGYIYPKSRHRYLNVSKIRNGYFFVRKVEKTDGIRDHKLEEQYLMEGYQMISNLMNIYDQVILSDESIWHASSYTYKTLFEDLKKQADQNGYRFVIIVYLRRQDTFILSRWNQAVKQKTGHDYALSCDEYIKKRLKKDGKILNYAQKLDAIAGVVGKENMLVRRFEPADWIDGSIVHDFMHAIGLKVTDEFRELEKDVNLRLGKNETELKRILNMNQNLSGEEVRFFGEYLKNQSMQSPEKNLTGMLSYEETKAFLDRFEEGNRYVAESYIGDGKPLFESEIKDLPKWNANNAQMLPDMMTFFTSVLADLYRKCQEQDREIARLQEENRAFQNRVLLFIDKVKHPIRTIWCRMRKHTVDNQ